MEFYLPASASVSNITRIVNYKLIFYFHKLSLTDKRYFSTFCSNRRQEKQQTKILFLQYLNTTALTLVNILEFSQLADIICDPFSSCHRGADLHSLCQHRSSVISLFIKSILGLFNFSRVLLYRSCNGHSLRLIESFTFAILPLNQSHQTEVLTFPDRQLSIVLSNTSVTQRVIRQNCGTDHGCAVQEIMITAVQFEVRLEKHLHVIVPVSLENVLLRS